MPTHTFQNTPSGGVLARVSTVAASKIVSDQAGAASTESFVVSFGWSGKEISEVGGLQRFLFSGINKYAAISAATLRVYTVGASATGGATVTGEIALVRKDGLWDAVSGTTGWTSAPLWDFGVILETSGGASTIIPMTASGSTTRNYPLNYTPVAGVAFPGDIYPTTVAQTISMPASGPQDLQRVRFFLSRNSLPAASGYVSIYNTVAQDGSDDRPTGSPLATSSGVSMLTYLTGAGSFINFDFAAPLTLAYNTRYAVVYAPDPSSNLARSNVRLMISGDAVTYASGTASVGFANKYAFQAQTYVYNERLPHHLGLSGTFPASGVVVGSRILRDFAWAADTIYDVDVTTLVQEWVDQSDYTADSILFSIQNPSGATPALGSLPTWNDAQLIVVEGENHQLSALLSGEAQLGSTCNIITVCSGTISGEAQLTPPSLSLITALGLLISGQAIFSSDLTVHACGWFAARSDGWFTAQSDSWFTPLTSGWFEPPEECT